MPRRNNIIKYKKILSPGFSNCAAKRQYINEREAIKTAEHQMLINFDLNLSVYKCDQCLKWHLTRDIKKTD